MERLRSTLSQLRRTSSCTVVPHALMLYLGEAQHRPDSGLDPPTPRPEDKDRGPTKEQHTTPRNEEQEAVQALVWMT